MLLRQLEDLSFQSKIDMKEKAMLRETLMELQSQREDWLLHGNLQNQLIETQAAEALMKRLYDELVKKMQALEGRMLQVFSMNADLVDGKGFNAINRINGSITIETS
jgi:hypothetical protein